LELLSVLQWRTAHVRSAVVFFSIALAFTAAKYACREKTCCVREPSSDRQPDAIRREKALTPLSLQARATRPRGVIWSGA
jgi:hypothetical protein